MKDMVYSSVNVERALNILATEPEDCEIASRGIYIIVKGQSLCLQSPDDREVLEMLMAYKEFGFAAGFLEQAARTMREMQARWHG